MSSGGVRSVLRIAEFRGLEAAGLVSTLGDQLARVALSVLVYDRTGSPALTALTYAVSFLPAILGGPLLSGLADRHPRRRVMVGCDLGRAALIALTAIPGAPLPLLLALLFAVGLLNQPFVAARTGVVRAAVGLELYAPANSVDQAVSQIAQLAGFGVAGVLVAASSPAVALIGDTASFLVSAGLLMAGVAARPATDEGRDGRQLRWLALAGADAAIGWRALMSDRLTRRAALFAWVGLAALIAPEGLAAPWADELHEGPSAVGLLLLASPLGTVLGLSVAPRLQRGGSKDPTAPMLWLLGIGLLPLIACLTAPALPIAIALLAMSGFGGSYIVLAQVLVVSRVPDAQLGRAVGVAGTGLTVAQAAALVCGGLATQAWRPSTAVGALALIASALIFASIIGTRASRTTAALPQT